MTTSTSAILKSVNPATGEVRGEYARLSPQQIEERLSRASVAFERWRATSIASRARLLSNLGRLLASHREQYARLITLEMGKPIAQARAEVEKCSRIAQYFATASEQHLAPESVETSARNSLVAFQPLGVILGITPWNYPFIQVMRFVLPAIAAGNAVVVKHASNVPECALAIEGLFHEADFPESVVNMLLITPSEAESLIRDSRVRAVSLTGSSAVGRRIAPLAGAALKKTVLELGGSDAFIVLADANVAGAAAAGVKARVINCGQACVAAKRFIVVEDVADDFRTKFIDGLRVLRVGDPMDDKTDVGPLAREDLRDTLHDQLVASQCYGATTLFGGKPRPGRGYFYEPTLIECPVSRRVPVMTDETFGPVAALCVVRDTDEAIAVANHSAFGLGASVWTRSVDKAKTLADRLDVGMVYFNSPVTSDPRLPFGGTKASGYGRELSRFGIREFTNIQTIWVAEP